MTSREANRPHKYWRIVVKTAKISENIRCATKLFGNKVFFLLFTKKKKLHPLLGLFLLLLLLLFSFSFDIDWKKKRKSLSFRPKTNVALRIIQLRERNQTI